MNKSTGFIGGGRITRIILQAFQNKGFTPVRVMITDTNPEVLGKLRKQYPFITEGSAEEVAKQQILFIALHAPAIIETLEKLKEFISPDAVVISLAPKITIEKISGILNGHKHVVRLIPNATSVINKGCNPITFSTGLSGREEILDLLTLLGDTFETEESKLEAYAIVSAMLPTYFWFQWQEMHQIGKKMGLTDNELNDTVEKTLIAAIETLYHSGMSYEEVIDLIPVRPIAAHEPLIKEILSNTLSTLFEKIKP